MQVVLRKEDVLRGDDPVVVRVMTNRRAAWQKRGAGGGGTT